MTKKMLITGVSGLLGNNLAYYFRDRFDILGLYFSHPVKIQGIKTEKADLLSKDLFVEIIQGFDPDIVIHCASLTNVDFCETNHEMADIVNVMGTRVVVESIKKRNTKLIYVSTDSVYDGYKGNFQESDPVNPQNYYGLSKYKGELEVLAIEESLILRTNIFGWNIQEKHSIAEWILSELTKNKQIRGFTDVLFSSIYTFDLAKVLGLAIDRNLSGIFNCGSRTSISKYEFALLIADSFKLNRDLIRPISIDEFEFKAKRGKNMNLNVSLLQNLLDHEMPSIIESVEFFFRDFQNFLPQKIKNNQKVLW